MDRGYAFRRAGDCLFKILLCRGLQLAMQLALFESLEKRPAKLMYAMEITRRRHCAQSVQVFQQGVSARNLLLLIIAIKGFENS
jgi:hypothetical protein